MGAEAVEITRTGTAGIDECRDRAAAREGLRGDAERRSAPVDMGVQVDEAGRDDFAGDIARVRTVMREAQLKKA